MGLKIHVYVKSLVLFFFDASGAQSNTFDVRKYGARADARSDTSKALWSAWKEACAAVGSSKIMIPKGTYLLGVVDLKGPCKGAMHLEVQGTFIAPTSPNAHNKASWITFAYIDRLTLSGGGTFDGRGEIAWKQNNCGQKPKCKSLPISLRFDFVTNSIVRDVTSWTARISMSMLWGAKTLPSITLQSLHRDIASTQMEFTLDDQRGSISLIQTLSPVMIAS
ncbi:polygalacturonase-like [Hevea brasiliensis]|uniref:polygalacturonase-like n=1 Tax=Hevea brasiliensis TaxID=3981 RepID=UPI0025DE8AC1|nr:polygalacturonase-like [Hevea brasiliensis]